MLLVYAALLGSWRVGAVPVKSTSMPCFRVQHGPEKLLHDYLQVLVDGKNFDAAMNDFNGALQSAAAGGPSVGI